MMKRTLGAVVGALMGLLAAPPAAQADTLPTMVRVPFLIKPVVNRPQLPAPGTPGRRIDVGLGLADFVAGYTATDAPNIVINDATRIVNGFSSATQPINLAALTANATPSAGSQVTMVLNPGAYAGGFSVDGATSYEVDRLSDPDLTRPIANLMRSRILIGDSTAMNCVPATTGSQAGTTSCNPTRSVAGIVTGWNPATGSLTFGVTAKVGTGTITAANAVLVRHYPENALITTPYLLLFGQPDLVNNNPVATDRNWDWRGYLNPNNMPIIKIDDTQSAGLIRLTQVQADWSSNILGAANGMIDSLVQPYSLDHVNFGWRPFRDAIQLTVAADATTGNTLKVVEPIPGIVGTMAACGVNAANCYQVTVPFNGGTVDTNYAGFTVTGVRKFWSVLDSSNPDAMFNAPVNSVIGQTITFDPVTAENGTFNHVRKLAKAGDKIWLFKWQTQIDATLQGSACDVTASRILSPEDMFFFIRSPYTTTFTSDGVSYPVNGCGQTTNPSGKLSWSGNLLTNMGFTVNTNHGDLIQTSAYTGRAPLSFTNNVAQSVHLNGLYNNGNPRDWTASNSFGAWSSDIEIAYNIMDASGLSSAPLISPHRVVRAGC